MKLIFKRIHLNYKQLVFYLFLFSSIVQMLLPSFLSLMISNGITLGNKKAVIIIGIIMMIVTVVSCCVSFLSVKLPTYISTDFSYQLRSKVFDKVQSFSAPEIDKFSICSLITRSTSDITNIQNFITLLLRIGLIAPMMAAVGLFFSATTGGKISSVLLVFIPLLIILLSIVIIYASKYSIKLRSLLDRINTLFLESLEGVKVIRAFNKQNKESQKFNVENNNYAKITMISERIGSLMIPIITVQLNLKMLHLVIIKIKF